MKSPLKAFSFHNTVSIPSKSHEEFCGTEIWLRWTAAIWWSNGAYSVFLSFNFASASLGHNRGQTKRMRPLECLYSGNKIENERHLLLDCQRYFSTRDIFLFNWIKNWWYSTIIEWKLINSNDYYVNLHLILLWNERDWFLRFGLLDKCYELYQCWNCTLNYRNYHAFDAFAMVYCYSHANKLTVVVVVVKSTASWTLFK